jgi:hypothetical protein
LALSKAATCQQRHCKAGRSREGKELPVPESREQEGTPPAPPKIPPGSAISADFGDSTQRFTGVLKKGDAAAWSQVSSSELKPGWDTAEAYSPTRQDTGSLVSIHIVALRSAERSHRLNPTVLHSREYMGSAYRQPLNLQGRLALLDRKLQLLGLGPHLSPKCLPHSFPPSTAVFLP